MPILPPANNFNDPTVTEGGFKSALSALLSYLAGLLGSDGSAATARTALGLGSAATANQGAGQGLDADKVDGLHASAFATATQLTVHTDAVNNPHATTAAQVGALASLNLIANPGGNIDLAAGANVTITGDASAKKITIAATVPPGGEANVGANVGSGPGAFYVGKSGVTLNFRTLKLGPVAIANGFSLAISGNDVILESPTIPQPSAGGA